MTHERKMWSIEEVRNLIEAFREHDNLWNVNHPDFRNRIKKIETFKAIAVLFDTTSVEIDRKIKNIVSQYNRERRNYQQMIKFGTGRNFIPKWFGYRALTFLHDSQNGRKKFRMERIMDLDMNSSDEMETNEVRSTNIGKTVNHIVNHPKGVQSRQQQRFSSFSTNTSRHTQPPITATNNNEAPNCSSTNDDNSSLSTDVLRTVLKSLFDQRSTISRRDEYDVYGEMVAHNLKNLKTEHARITVQHCISNLLYEARLGHYDFASDSALASPVITPSPFSNGNYNATSAAMVEMSSESPTTNGDIDDSNISH